MYKKQDVVDLDSNINRQKFSRCIHCCGIVDSLLDQTTGSYNFTCLSYHEDSCTLCRCSILSESDGLCIYKWIRQAATSHVPSWILRHRTSIEKPATCATFVDGRFHDTVIYKSIPSKRWKSQQQFSVVPSFTQLHRNLFLDS